MWHGFCSVVSQVPGALYETYDHRFVFGLTLSPSVSASPSHAGCSTAGFGKDFAQSLKRILRHDTETVYERTRVIAREQTEDRQAALATIRYAEGADYDRLFGWFENKSRVFDPTTQVGHPDLPYTSSGGGYTSTAAGAYQAMPATWNEEVERGTITNDFTPANQDRFAIARLEYRGLLDEVQAGNTAWIDSVEMGREWASFPNSPYGQPTHTSANLRSYYDEQLRAYQLLN